MAGGAAAKWSTVVAHAPHVRGAQYASSEDHALSLWLVRLHGMVGAAQGGPRFQEHPMQTLVTSRVPRFGVDLAFELGWDFAHYGVQPPSEALLNWPQLAQGVEAGRQTFGARTLHATRHARKWLQVRLNALNRGRVFDTEQVTPRFLQLIDTEVCPVTRMPLTYGTGACTDWSVDRVFNDAAYAAGNLAVMSRRANEAKADAAFHDAVRYARDCEGGVSEIDGLDAAQWGRVAVLMSFVTRLAHQEAAVLPMLVLPPNRLRVFNPIQALQAVLCRLVLAHAESEDAAALDDHIDRLRQHVPGKALRKDVLAFTDAYVAQVRALRRAHPALGLRGAVEDAWQTRLVLNRWKRIARALTAAQAEAIVVAAGQGTRCLPDTQATEGWALATRGLLSPRPVPRPLPDPKVSLPAEHWLAARQSDLFAAS